MDSPPPPDIRKGLGKRELEEQFGDFDDDGEFHLYMENLTGDHEKFYEVLVNANVLTTQWGKLGTVGSSNTKTFNNPEDARREGHKVVASKTTKSHGYSVMNHRDASDPPPAKKPCEEKSRWPMSGKTRDSGVALRVAAGRKGVAAGRKGVVAGRKRRVGYPSSRVWPRLGRSHLRRPQTGMECGAFVAGK